MASRDRTLSGVHMEFTKGVNLKKVYTVLLRINAGGVHLIFDFFWRAFIQGRRLYEGGIYYKIQKKLQFYISRSMISLSSILKTALSASSTPGICDQIERVRTTRFV